MILPFLAGVALVAAAYLGTPPPWLARDVIWLAGVLILAAVVVARDVLVELADRDRRREARR